MAQTIQLKRSSTQGKVPSTSNLSLGELAINTYDGRIFLEKNDGSAAIVQIVTTDSVTTGSIELTQTGSFGQIELDDSKYIKLGTGDDFTIHHNGTNTTLENETGDLYIINDTNDGDIIFQSDDASGGTETYLTIDGGSSTIEAAKATNFAAAVNIDATTQSTSKTTGALIVDGGVGIAKTLQVGEDVVAYASSDIRYKDNIIKISNPNEKIKQLNGYEFDWNDKHEIYKGTHDVGVIAQEVEKVLPEIVTTRDSGYKAVKYEKIVALLIESNKELIDKVEELEKRINDLEADSIVIKGID